MGNYDLKMKEQIDNYKLDFDKQIWTVFSVGVVPSLIILYYFLSGKFGGVGLKIFALTSGFAILVYCFFAILGYQVKQSIAQENSPLKRRLDKILYSRVRWMAEGILIWFILIYFYAFYRVSNLKEFSNFEGILTLCIPCFIFLIFLFLCLIANLYPKRKFYEEKLKNIIKKIRDKKELSVEEKEFVNTF